MNQRIIAIDDEQDFLETVKRGLITSGFTNLLLERDSQKAAALFAQGGQFDLALIDVSMRGMDGVALLEFIKRTSPDTECLMVTAVNDARVAVECLKKGAYDYLMKPISREDLVQGIQRALERKRLLEVVDLGKRKTVPHLVHREAFRHIITRSEAMLKLLKEAELHATSNVPVLITGESGTGKELLARAIHLCSHRAQFPFTPVNMASLSSTLFDAEFFGHTKGAFTGAEKDRPGYLEHSHRGTLFLDEIGSLPPDFQGKLLRVLQEGEYMKLGSSKPQRVDVRFMAATNNDLDRLIAQGSFRKDLYYRLKGAWIHLPPLRERKEDLPLLINQFMKDYQRNGQDPRIEREALAVLTDYDYPGNIRELKSILQASANLAQGQPISTGFLPEHLRHRRADSSVETSAGVPLPPLAEVERHHIIQAYKATGKNKLQTSKLLHIGLNTLRRRLEAYGLE
jgi:DNA-binding NtrC family response regulator